MEARWLAEHGLTANYDDYVALPIAVLEDARLQMEGEALAERKAAAKGGR